MTLKRLYIFGVLFPGLVAIIATAISATFDNNNYKSEWLTKDAVIGMSLMASLIHSVIISVLSLAIFLNLKRQSVLLTFLSWFLLPFTWISITACKTVAPRLNEAIGTKGELVYLITLNLPFVTGLIVTYTFFVRHKVAANSN